MTTKRFTTNGYYIYDHFKEDKWLVNEVEAEEIVTVMNNLDTKARERSKALGKLQKENEQLKLLNNYLTELSKDLNGVLFKENNELKQDILRLMYTAEHLVNIKKLEERWGIDYNQFLSDLRNGDEHL